MAQLTYKDGRGILQFYDLNGARRSMRLGKIAEDHAHAIKLKVEDLINALDYGQPILPETRTWLDSISINFTTNWPSSGWLWVALVGCGYRRRFGN
jgi:hypothetical protein